MLEWKVSRFLLEGHDKRFSILGCNQTLFRDNPAARVLVRGVIFGQFERRLCYVECAHGGYAAPPLPRIA